MSTIKNNNNNNNNTRNTAYCAPIEHYDFINDALSYSVHIERALMHTPLPTKPMFMVAQSGDEEDDMRAPPGASYPYLLAGNTAFRMFRKHVEEKTNYCDVTEFIVDSIDQLAQLAKWYSKCDCFDDYLALCNLACRLLTGKAASTYVNTYVRRLFITEAQADFGDILKVFRTGLDTVMNATKSPLVEKVSELYSFLLIQGFLSRLGCKIEGDEYTRLYKRAKDVNYKSRPALWLHVLDTTLFVCERLWEFRITGDVSTFIHSDVAYSKWLTEADRLIGLAPFTSNLEPHGTTYFSFVSDISDTIEKGTAYAKFTTKSTGADSTIIKKKLVTLQLIKNTELTRRAAQRERKAPMGVLIHGKSSVAKSTFSKLLFYYYAKLFRLEDDDHFRYVRNPADPYWSNFDSSKWCVQLDDIAFLKPNGGEVDPTLMELICVQNNVSFVPPQAALEDKGKTPLLCKLVTATTNVDDLNASAYFQCPLAIQRRLGYVIEVSPKDEFKHENGSFIDPKKLPELRAQNGFPDYWNITVKCVKPIMNGGREFAQLTVVEKYTDIKTFLKHFGAACMQHELNQEKAMKCDAEMRNIHVCPVCMCAITPDAESPCDCVLEPQACDGRWFMRMVRKITWWMFLFCMRLHLTACVAEGLTYYDWCRSLVCKWYLPYQLPSIQVRFLGAINERLSQPRDWKKFLKVLGTVVAIASTTVLAYKTVSTIKTQRKQTPVPTKATPVKEKTEDDDMESCAGSCVAWTEYDEDCVRYDSDCKKCGAQIKGNANINLDAQGNIFGTTETDLPPEAKANVWHNDTLELSRFDLPIAGQSLANASPEKVRDLFSANCVCVEIRVAGLVPARVWRTGGVFVKGNMLLLNNHPFKDLYTSYNITIIQSRVCNGLTQNITFVLKESEVVRVPEQDFCVFSVMCVAPKKDIFKFWAETVNPSRCVTIKRTSEGTIEHQQILAVDMIEQMPIQGLPPLNLCMGVGERETMIGDCGSLGVATTPVGVAIVGIHVAGNGRHVGILRLPASEVQKAMSLCAAKQNITEEFIVSGGGAPMLGLKDKPVELIELHHKSVFNFIEEGSANVYGSLTLPRMVPKSRVCATPLQAQMLEHFNIEVNHGAPAMAGWEPWRKNVIDMIKPEVLHDADILADCVEAYTADILSELPTGWEAQMMFLSREAAVNGLPGVIYIDKLNASTSMGHPWNTTKKNFILPAPTEAMPLGITFIEEVWERVSAIEECYAQGRRAFPVFTGHLKDEATPLKKCAIKKTRMFTGGPVDWSLVVRSRLLTFVRLLQKNKFVFEAGPGTVTQSTEWGMIYDYLTAFGTDRMVAGDFGKYDKKMTANFILAAFQVITNVCRAAGYSESECREIMCIGNDIAFPVVNVRGDLVQFFGTNPSGHPLTVIVNSLVNSLYGRYVYHTCNPARECKTFKQNVHLFTYGDDNIMGVSERTPWFNHTAYQAVMATIGVEYTMPDKEAESVPYVDIADCSFLKRKWVFDTDVGAWLAPLEEASMHKSLTMWVPSKSIDEYAQMVAVISSANNEFFFHGRETFEKHRSFFAKLLEEEPYSLYVKPSTLPRWDELVHRFWKASEDAPQVGGVQADPTEENFVASEN